MSRLWCATRTAAAVPSAPWARAPSVPFRAWAAAEPEEALFEAYEEEPGPAITPEQVETARQEAFAAGFDEGVRAAEQLVAQEHEAVARLAAALEALTPQPSDALGMVIAEAVERLVRGIVGETPVDRATLIARAEAAAALVAEETTPTRLRLHPDDLARVGDTALPVRAVADPRLEPGTILLETAEGWIEDGPAARLAAMRDVLDRMAVL